MKISNLTECTTAGAVATVAQPFETVQKRTPEKKLKGSNLLKGIKTSAKYANSLHDGIEEAQSLGGALNNALSKVEPGSKLDQKIKTHNRQVKSGVKDKQFMMTSPPEGYHFKKDGSVALGEGAKVDRMVGHVKSSEKKLGKSSKEAENIAWATANKRGMLDNKNKVKEGYHNDVKNAWNSGMEDDEIIQRYGHSALNRLKQKHGEKSIPVTDLHGFRQQEPTDPLIRSHRGLDGNGKQLRALIKQQGVAEGSETTYEIRLRKDGGDKLMARNVPKSQVGAKLAALSKKHNVAVGEFEYFKTGDLKEQGVAESVDYDEMTRAHELMNRVGDADMSYEEIVGLLIDNGFSQEVADHMALDSGRQPENRPVRRQREPLSADRKAKWDVDLASILGKNTDQGVAEGSANEGREPMVGETCFIRNYNGHVVLQALSGDKARVKFDNGRVETVSRKDLIPQSEKVNSLWEGKGEKPATKEKPNPYAKSNPDTLANKKNKKVYKKKPEHNDYAQSDPDADYDDNKIDEGRFVKGPGGVPLDRQGNAIPPKPQAEPKAPAVRRDANGLTRADYNTVWRKIEDVVGQIFPDGDPIDWLGPWLDRQGIKDYHGGEVLNKACRLNGYKDIYAYYDHFKTDDYGYEEPVREAKKEKDQDPHITAGGDSPTIKTVDPELRRSYEYALQHYPSSKTPEEAMTKLIQRQSQHGLETDKRQDTEINKLKQDVVSLKAIVVRPGPHVERRAMARPDVPNEPPRRAKVKPEAPVGDEINEEDLILTPGKGRQHKPGLLHKQEVSVNPTDTVKVDVPLLIRLLEFAREDAKTDMDLHDLAEKLVAGCKRGRTLTMKDYDRLVPEKQPEAPAPDEEPDFEGQFSQEMAR